MLKMRILNEQNRIQQSQESEQSTQQKHKKKHNKPEIRRGPMTLKTNLKDVPICEKLRKFKPQIFSELVNQPLINKPNNISIGRSFKNMLNKTILKIQDTNRTQVDINLFSKLRSNPPTLFNNRMMDATQISPFQMQQPPSGLFEENKFRNIINENYSSYTLKIKKMYPAFKFNHYSKISNDTYIEYFKKYGEEGDINNRNFIIKENVAYKKSDLLDILGVQDNISAEPENFKIKTDFLSRNDIYEIMMIQNDLSFKTGILNKELNSILKAHASKLFNFYEKNKFLKKEIENYLDNIKYKQFINKDTAKKYRINSIMLVKKGSKKTKILKILSQLYSLNNIRKDITDIENMTSNEKNKNKNQIKQISDSINLTKEKIKTFKNNFESSNQLIIIKEIEKIIINLGSKGEESLNSQFHKSIGELFNLFVLYKKESVEEQKEQKETNWDLSLEKSKDESKGIFFINEDFELIEEKTNLYIKYLLIYNNMNNNRIYSKLIEIMDLFEVIIKDGVDINTILKVFIDVLKKIIIHNFDYIEKESNNKLVIIYIIANCYAILLSNYFYILQLIQKNFGLLMKLFNDVTKILITEMDKFISIVILAYLHETIFEREWIEFLKGIILAQKYSHIYISNTNTNLNWDALTNDVFREYLSNFNNTVTNNLLTEISKIDFNEVNDIDIEYQQMFEILYTFRELESLEPDQIDIKLLYQNKESNDKNNFIIIPDENNNENDKKHKISKLSYLYIKYSYQILYIAVSTNNDDLKDSVVQNYLKLTIDILKIINNIFISPNNNINEKQISLCFSDLIIIEKSLCVFLDLYENEELENLLKEMEKARNDEINALVNQTVTNIINNFISLSFSNYPIIKGDYNDYAKYFSNLKNIYDNTTNCLFKNDIIKIFTTSLDYLFKEFNKLIISKGVFVDKEKLKQFESELFYIEKILAEFKMINIDKYIETIHKILLGLDPKIQIESGTTARKATEEDDSQNSQQETES